MSRVFTFGCSFTSFFWPTWADIIINDFENRLFELPSFEKVNNNENNFFSWGRKSKNVKTLLLKNYYTKYSKYPHDLSKILNSDFGLFYSQNYMFMLNQYCVSNNIKLIWTFLEIDYLNSLNNLGE